MFGIGAFLAESALMQSPLGPLLQRFWKPLLIALAIGLAVFFAMRWYHGQISAAEARGYHRAVEDGRKVAKKTDDKTTKISSEIRSKIDETNRHIAARADDQRVRGPGAARCPAPPAASGGHDEASGKPDATGPGLLAEDSAAVPWPWLVERAKQCDLNRNEVLAWREWHERVLEAWPVK